MTPLDFYRTQADRSTTEAANATLDNVRDRCLRAAAAWDEMAKRIERTDAMRASRNA